MTRMDHVISVFQCVKDLRRELGPKAIVRIVENIPGKYPDESTVVVRDYERIFPNGDILTLNSRDRKMAAEFLRKWRKFRGNCAWSALLTIHKKVLIYVWAEYKRLKMHSTKCYAEIEKAAIDNGIL